MYDCMKRNVFYPAGSAMPYIRFWIYIFEGKINVNPDFFYGFRKFTKSLREKLKERYIFYI